ncbi:unnamed protein product [Cochlearia groenlandica]
MGNCIRHESEMHWAGEDWDQEDDHYTIEEEDKKVIVKRDVIKSSNHHHEIKIRLTKKQLHDLLTKVNDHDLKGFHHQQQQQQQQALSCPNLVNYYELETGEIRSWRPVLKSIPEVN